MSLIKGKRWNVHIVNDYTKVFVLCLIIGAVIFLPFLILDKGYFLYYGDFNVQQIPFYKLANQAIKDGNIFWNWNTDLGANFIGSYSFYLLGSPFFWLTLLFPTEFVPFLMAPLLILKTACAGVTGFAFIKRFTATNHFAMLGAMMYAFCGFNIYNIFFNHFHEAVIVFPLLLVALEESVVNNRRGWFALTVFLAATVNYFFFVGQVVFVIIYFILRCFSKDFKITPIKFLILALEAVIGLLLSSCLLLPSILAITQNNRISNFYTGMDMLMYRNEQRYGLILQSLFFPPDIPARPNFFPDSNAKWSSVSAYLPLFGMTGVIVFLKSKKGHWLKRLLLLSGLMAMVPILNSAFYAFNSSYYARWFYMPTLMMALATCLVLEDEEIDLSFGIKVSGICIAAFSLIGILPSKVKENDSSEEVLKWFSIPPYPERFWGYIVIAVISLLCVTVLNYYLRNSKVFMRRTMSMLCLMIVIYSITIIGSGKSNSSSDIYELIVDEGLHNTLDLEQNEFYRVDEDKALDNMPMYWGLPTIQCFHSVVPPSIMEFYQSIGVERNVASRPETSVYALRGLTSVKYLLCRTSEQEQPYLPGFESIGVQNNYQIYENQYFVPMGFTYDYAISVTEYETYAESNRDKLLMKAMCLSDEDIERFSDILPTLPVQEPLLFNEQEYFQNCLERNASSGYDFTYDSQGFTSKIELERENLVFYSVPYEEGWSAKVNGEPVEIIRSNVGFMAVLAPAGDNEIVFYYQTPGLKAGIIISLVALCGLLVYLWIMDRLRKKYPDSYKVTSIRTNQRLPYQGYMKVQDAYLQSIMQKLNQKDEK